MAKTNKFQEIMDNAVKLLAGIIRKLKKMDRRFLVMAGVAFVLVIVMLSLIIHGVKVNKNDEETSTRPDYSNITEEKTTDAEPENSFVLKGDGKYKINPGSSPYLNVRLAADKNTSVVTTIPNGTEVEVMFIDDSDVKDADDFGWGYVEYNGKRGWVFMEYLVK